MNGKHYCNKPGCPGHSYQWEMCPISIPKVDIRSSIPDVKLPDLNPPKLNIPDVKPINIKPLEKHYCGKQNCPGHYVQGQTCINLGDILNQ